LKYFFLNLLTSAFLNANFKQTQTPISMKNLSTLLSAFALSTISFSQVVTIHDIQYTASVSGVSPLNGNVVTTYGIVTGVFDFGEAGTFFIQDGDGAWNGVYVNEGGYMVTLGDSVEVTGTVTEYYGLTEINSVTNVTVINSGNPQPNPVLIPTSDVAQEKYEGVLVKVTEAVCTNSNAGFGQFIVDDSSGNCLIDDQIYQYTPTLNYVYEITGARHFLLGESKICPRMAEDIVVQFALGIEENNTFSVYPNPASDILVLNVQPTSFVQIYSMNGSLVFEGTGETTLDISEFESGIYQVTVLQNDKISTQKLIVN
jgi:predicted extracellular nuclease